MLAEQTNSANKPFHKWKLVMNMGKELDSKEKMLEKEIQLVKDLMPCKMIATHDANYGILYDSLLDCRNQKEYEMKIALLQLASRGSVELSFDSVTGEVKAQKVPFN